MKLAFVFIEDYKIIKQKLFSFDGRLVFHIEGNVKKQGHYQLKVELNDAYVNIFPKRVLGMTGLVGKNGAGKSTIINCIKLLFGQLHLLTAPLIFGFFDEEKNILQIYYYEKGGVENMISLFVTINNLTDDEIIISKPIPYEIDRLWDNPRIKGIKISDLDITCCYFSAAFDSSLEVVYKNIENISVNYKVEDFLKRHIEEEIEDAKNEDKSKRKDIQLWPSHISKFYTEELVKKVKFIAYANKRDTSGLPPLPESLALTFKFDDYNALTEGRTDSIFVDKSKLVEIQKLAISHVTSNDSQRHNFLNLLILCSFYYSLRAGLLKIDQYTLDTPTVPYQRLITEPDRLFENLREILSKDAKGDDRKTKIIQRFLGRDFDNRLGSIDFGGNTKRYDKAAFSVGIDNALFGVLSLIYDLPGFDNSNFLKYNWRGLSTGEEALLTQYARFYELKSKVKSKSLLILIDEGDLYFHPQWQKEYISRLLQFIPFIFLNKNLQFILTTHSPFIASDLPKQNLIFLERNSDSACIIADPLQQPETFGANIHELFTESFFLSDGLMGEFARKNINELIKEINERQRITVNDFNKNFKKRIHIIGEEFIKAKLLELVAQKGEINLIDQIISGRSNELEQLRQIRQAKKR
jgi:energy-coupling factor transporter ATP-binding protein EcfA2